MYPAAGWRYKYIDYVGIAALRLYYGGISCE
jgi:hypothetical protein